MIDLDRRPPPAHRRPAMAWPGWLVLMAGLALLAGAVGGVVALAQRADASPAPATHTIEFVIEGTDAAVDHASIDGRDVGTGEPLSADSLAIVTVRSADSGLARCVIVVDGARAYEAIASYGQSATCVWSAG